MRRCPLSSRSRTSWPLARLRFLRQSAARITGGMFSEQQMSPQCSPIGVRVRRQARELGVLSGSMCRRSTVHSFRPRLGYCHSVDIGDSHMFPYFRLSFGGGDAFWGACSFRGSPGGLAIHLPQLAARFSGLVGCALTLSVSANMGAHNYRFLGASLFEPCVPCATNPVASSLARASCASLGCQQFGCGAMARWRHLWGRLSANRLSTSYAGE